MIISQTTLKLGSATYPPGAPVPLEAIPDGRLERMLGTGQLIQLKPIPAPPVDTEEE